MYTSIKVFNYIVMIACLFNCFCFSISGVERVFYVCFFSFTYNSAFSVIEVIHRFRFFTELRMRLTKVGRRLGLQK